MAETAAAAAPTPVDPVTAKALADASVAKAQAEARKAGADADTAAAGARTATVKAILGELPAAPSAGTVTASENAALAEHNQLARLAVAEIANRIAAEAVEHATGPNFYVTADDAGPSRAAAESFAFQRQLVQQALDGAVALSDKLEPAATPDGSDSITVAAIGLVLSGINAVLSYAKTDYTLAGREFALGDRMLVTAVAHALLAKKKIVRVDGPGGAVTETIRKALIDELSGLSQRATDARERAARRAATIKQLSPRPAAPAMEAALTQPPPDPDPHNQLPLHEHALQALTSAIKLHDDFEAALLAVADGVSGLQRVAVARALSAFLEEPGSALLVVKLNSVVGSSLSEKNLWASTFGHLKYALSVLVQASWRCFDPVTLLLRGAGLVAEYRPFKDIKDI